MEFWNRLDFFRVAGFTAGDLLFFGGVFVFWSFVGKAMGRRQVDASPRSTGSRSRNLIVSLVVMPFGLALLLTDLWVFREASHSYQGWSRDSYEFYPRIVFMALVFAWVLLLMVFSAHKLVVQNKRDQRLSDSPI